MIIYPYLRIPTEIRALVPDKFHVAHSESGWMTSKNFFEFIANAFIPWLDDQMIARPVVLFVDGHKTHVTMQASVLCQDNGVILYLLPPNTTHILQPADVGPFRPMKHYWREQVIQFQRENPNQQIQRKDVAPLLHKAMQLVAKKSIRNGFKKSGIFPFDVDAVDYKKCLEVISNETDDDDDVPDEPMVEEKRNFKEAFQCIKKVLGEDNTARCLEGQLDVLTLTEMVRTIGRHSGDYFDPSSFVEKASSHGYEIVLDGDGGNSIDLTRASSIDTIPGPSSSVSNALLDSSNQVSNSDLPMNNYDHIPHSSDFLTLTTSSTHLLSASSALEESTCTITLNEISDSTNLFENSLPTQPRASTLEDGEMCGTNLSFGESSTETKSLLHDSQDD